MEQADLATRIKAVTELRGTFTLRSGLIATTYFDKYRFEANPELLGEVAAAMTLLIPSRTEVLAGLEMGGIPIVTAMSLRSGLPAAFVRKEAKTYGTCRLAEGADTDGKAVLVVEDVVTTGGQLLISIADLRERGANIDYAICAIDRGQGGRQSLAAIGVTLISLFSQDDQGQWVS